MTDETFAANLRAEMAARRIGPAQLYEAVGSDRFWQLNRGGFASDLPTPAEISAVATALGCPEERLTVSREELERRLAEAEVYPCQRPSCAIRIKALSDEVDRIPALLREIEEYRDRELHLSQMLQIEREEGDHHATRASKLDCERTDLEYRVAELERRLAYAEAACADVSWECGKCARVAELEAENLRLRKGNFR